MGKRNIMFTAEIAVQGGLYRVAQVAWIFSGGTAVLT